MSTLISLRVPDEEIIRKIDEIAESLDRNRNWVINEAIKEYLDLHSWQIEHVEKGIADSQSGRTLSQEQVKDRIAKLQKTSAKSRKR